MSLYEKACKTCRHSGGLELIHTGGPVKHKVHCNHHWYARERILSPKISPSILMYSCDKHGFRDDIYMIRRLIAFMSYNSAVYIRRIHDARSKTHQGI